MGSWVKKVKGFSKKNTSETQTQTTLVDCQRERGGEGRYKRVKGENGDRRFDLGWNTQYNIQMVLYCRVVHLKPV